MTCMSASTKASKFGLHVSFQSLWSSLGLSGTILIDLAVYELRMSHVLFPTLRNTYLYVRESRHVFSIFQILSSIEL